MRFFPLLLVACLSSSAWAGGDFDVRLGSAWIEVEGKPSTSQVRMPANAEILEAGDGRLHYRLSLQTSQGVVVSSPGRWLPRGSSGDYRLRIHPEAGLHYVTSLQPSGPDRYQVSEVQVRKRPLFAYGHLQVRTHHFGDRELVQASVPQALALPDQELARWVERTGQAVSRWFGRFPVDRAVLLITPATGGGIQGVTYGEGGPHIYLKIPRNYSAAQIADSWQLCHELVHLAVPDMPYQHRWLEEGIATYVEPLIRRQMGLVSDKKVWSDLVEGLPRGLAEVSDGGLDGNHSWGATYWGGALFCLVVDVRLRAESHNLHTFQQALRGVTAQGNISQSWTLSQFLDTAGAAVHSQVLEQVHEEMAQAGERLDLDQLWQKLGVQERAGHLLFVAAPLDFVRQGIAPGG